MANSLRFIGIADETDRYLEYDFILRRDGTCKQKAKPLTTAITVGVIYENNDITCAQADGITKLSNFVLEGPHGVEVQFEGDLQLSYILRSLPIRVVA